MPLGGLALTAAAYFRFVDRDMAARHLGMSVGSGELQAHERESMLDDPTILGEIEAAAARAKAPGATADLGEDQVAADTLDNVEDADILDLDGSDSSSADHDAFIADFDGDE